MSESDTSNKTGILTEEEIKEPAMYAVLVHNDSFTPRGFVIEVLQRYFQKSSEEAQRIMLRAHNHGVGVAGVYSYEVAETKAAMANKYAHDQGKLLLFSVEKA